MKTATRARFALLLLSALPLTAVADANSDLRAIEEIRRAAIKAAKGTWVCVSGQSTPLPG